MPICSTSSACPRRAFWSGRPQPACRESGHMGREEIDVIEPVLQQLRAEGMQLIGPPG
jgi:hypothetical protein